VALAAGHNVIADATFLREADRRRLATVARRHRLPCAFVECRAGEDVIRRRLEVRDEQPSLSDARWDTYVGQRAQFEPFKTSEPHVVIDTSESVEVARATALRQLWEWRHGHPLGHGG
jgi:predicted kinase